MILHTNITGIGEPIVFLHTGLQTGEIDFTHQQKYFEQNYKVLSPDLRGHGKSVGDVNENYFTVAAEDLQETLIHHQVQKIHLVGCSLGAIVAIKFAKLFPDFISTLTVSGISPVKPDNWLELHNSDVSVQKSLLKNEEAIGYFDNLHDTDWRQFIYLGQNEDWYPFKDMKAFDDFNFQSLFVVGERNPWETVAVNIYPKNNKNVHVAVIPFAGHLVHTEQPELYCKVLDEFLRNTNE